ncbi:hypothetical protein [Dorea sp.]
MITGTTESGFTYEIPEEALDDYELFEDLCAVDNGEVGKITKVARGYLGNDQMQRLKDHVRNKETGRVSLKKMVEEITNIMMNNKQGNS